MTEENPNSLHSSTHFSDDDGNNSDGGWETVIYDNRGRLQRRSSTKPSSDISTTDGGNNSNSNIFLLSVQQQADHQERHLCAPEPPKVADHEKNEDGDDDQGTGNGTDNNEEVTVVEASSKIDASDLAIFLIDISGSFESQHDIQLMRFADYFARAYSDVSASQFPWTNIFKESTVAELADIPLANISNSVYKTSVVWIKQRSVEAVGSFVLWLLDSILVDLGHQQGTTKGSKKVAQPASQKSQIAIFMVLAMVLRCKPDLLISLFPILREDLKYQGQDKLRVIVWVIAQASKADLVVGVYSWVHYLLPIVTGESCNPMTRDLILQLIERILSAPKAKTILMNGAVRKGERLVPPSALETLMGITFPGPESRIKEISKRFIAVYPFLKEVALAGAPQSKARKKVSQEIFRFVIKTTGQSNTELSKESAAIFIWCLTENLDCYKQWENVYLENIEASTIILKKLCEEWKEHSVKRSSLDPLWETLKRFRQKNEKALLNEEVESVQEWIKDADKYCKVILRRLTGGNEWIKRAVVAFAVVAVGVFVMMSPNMESWDWKKLP